MAHDHLIQDRYRVIYVVDEQPGMRLLRCRDDQTGRLALVSELAQIPAQSHAMLLGLANAVRSFQHAMLMPLFDFFVNEQGIYLVCDDPGGQDLERALRARGGPLEPVDTARQLQQILALLEQLHAHRPALLLGDLRSTDVWLTDAGRLVILPFALVRPVGTVLSPYRAPELLRPGIEPNEPTDLYAIGAITYHMLTGWAPPAAEQIQQGMPLNSPRTLNPHIPPLLEQAVLRAMQPRAQNRYQRAREMRVAVEAAEVLTNKPATGAMIPSYVPDLGSVVAPVMVPQPVPGTLPAAAPPPPAQRAVSGGCIAAVVIGLILAVIAACVALLLLFTPLRSMVGPGGNAATGVAQQPQPTVIVTPVSEVAATPGVGTSTDALVPTVPTPIPIALNDNAITLANATTITVTREITTSQYGPVAYAPNGALVAIGIGARVELRNADTLERQQTLDGHPGAVTSLAWSADGALLATASGQDSAIRVYETASWTLKQTLTGHTSYIRSLAFSPKGTVLASGGADQTIRLWDASSGQFLHELKGHTGMLGGLAFSPDGSRLASGSRDGSVRLWDVASGTAVSGFRFETEIASGTERYWTTGVAFSPDGQTLAVGSSDTQVYLLDATTGKQIRSMVGHSGFIIIRGVFFSADGKKLYTASMDSDIRIWDPATGQSLGVLEGHSSGIFAMTLHPDGKQLLSAASSDGIAIRWDLTTNQRQNFLFSGFGEFQSLGFSPNGQIISLHGLNGFMQLDQDGQQLLQAPLQTAPVVFHPFAFLTNSSFAYITDQQKIMYVNAQSQQSSELAGLTGVPYTLAASRDGRFLAAAGDGQEIVIWEVATSTVTKRLKTDLTIISLLAFSYTGDRLAVAGATTTPQVEVWNLASDSSPQHLPELTRAVSSITFQPGGNLLAVTSLDGTLRLWDAVSGISVRRSQGGDAYMGAGFSADGTMLATAARNGLLQLWNVQSGQEVASYQFGNLLITLEFAADGRTIAVSRIDGIVQLFSLPTS